MYAQPECSHNALDLSHELLVVGYGVSDEGVPYWITKNRYYAHFQWESDMNYLVFTQVATATLSYSSFLPAMERCGVIKDTLISVETRTCVELAQTLDYPSFKTVDLA